MRPFLRIPLQLVAGAALSRMAEKNGFRVASRSGSWISYTMNLSKEL